jgi:hypothetical protein
MLLPALSRAKDKAMLTVDLNNNRQLMLASQMYATDNSDYFAWPSWGDTGTVASWATGSRQQVGFTMNLTPRPVAKGNAKALEDIRSNQFVFIQNSLLAKYQGKSYKIYWCPFDGRDRDYLTRNVLTVSYCWNGAVSGYSATLSKIQKTTKFQPDDILQWEQSEIGGNLFNDTSNQPDEPISQRHSSGQVKQTSSSKNYGGGGSIGLMSGTVQYIKYKDFNAEERAGRTRLWCNPLANDGHY